MPELPEVEAIKIQLNKYLVGHTIQKVEVRYAKCFSGKAVGIVGAKVKEVERFGKALAIGTNKGLTLLIHVKMTGQLIYRGPNLKKPGEISKKVLGGLGGKHTHVIFHLDHGGMLYYNDVRKFGWIKIVQSAKLKEQSSFLDKLGPEPHLTKGSAGQAFLTLDLFRKIISKSKSPVKMLLMDQEKIAGVGNIYANDALWLAKVNPGRKASELSELEIGNLFNAVETVLKKGIEKGGASESAFVTPDGTEGEYQDHTLVYGRKGELCTRCGKAEIEKIKLGGRGTYFCPFCQP
jgi:formamidopyrimidine-DNA glycosylase